jgi:hypothetical protein
MDTTDVIMRLMATLNRFDLVRVKDFQTYLILKMGAEWYVERSNKEASTLPP